MNEKKIKLLKRICFIILTVAFLGETVFGFVNSKYTSGNAKQVVTQNSTSLGMITNGVSVEQSFVAKEDFYGIAVLTATFDRSQKGILKAYIIDNETNDIVYSDTFMASEVNNNQHTYFASNNLIEVDGEKEFTFVIEGKIVPPTYGITAWITAEDVYKDGTLTMNGVEMNADMCFGLVDEYESGRHMLFWLKQTMVLFLLYVFLSLHCFLDIRAMYQQIYKYRWLIGTLLFIFAVLNKFNGSSIAQYDIYVQTGFGSDFAWPLFGRSRAIRSDEWLVSVPRIMSAEYTNYGLYNDIVRGTKTTNLSASGLYLNYSALAKPSDWGYYLFGSEYGLSFIWSFQLIYGFLFSFDFFQIITKYKNKLIAFMGACITWFSIYNMYWSMVAWIFTGQAALVLFYYFLQEEKIWKRTLFGIGIAIFGADYAVNLYPAWQVPGGYVILMILIWLFIDNMAIWKKWKIKDWLVTVICIIFMISLVVVYLYNDRSYLTEISNTVYPGTRVDYGGFSWNKLLNYYSSLLSPYTDFSNASEMGCFYSLFPISIILYIFVLIKKRGHDLLMWLLMIPTVVIGAYCTTALPEAFVKYSLMSYTTSARAADVLGYINVLMLIIALAEYENLKQMKWYIGLGLSCIMAWLAWGQAVRLEEKRVLLCTVILAVITVIVSTVIISKCAKWMKSVAMVVISIMVMITGLSINPLMCGLDAITSKPVASVVTEIVKEDEDAIWIDVDSIVLGNYLIALGARTLNSTNYVPNMEFWQKLYPNGENEEVYNRYAHLQITLTDEDMDVQLPQGDYIQLTLNYEQLEQFGVKYLYSPHELESKLVDLELLYCEYGSYIYKITY